MVFTLPFSAEIPGFAAQTANAGAAFLSSYAFKPAHHLLFRITGAHTW
jgi:hypothetical protein